MISGCKCPSTVKYLSQGRLKLFLYVLPLTLQMWYNVKNKHREMEFNLNYGKHIHEEEKWLFSTPFLKHAYPHPNWKKKTINFKFQIQMQAIFK